jgi:hypothetical protein
VGIKSISWHYYGRVIMYVRVQPAYIAGVAQDIAQVFFAAFIAEFFAKSVINWKLVFWSLFLAIVLGLQVFDIIVKYK